MTKYLRSHYNQHVKAKHKRAKAKEKAKVEKVIVSEAISKTIETIGILKELQVSVHLSEEEKKILGDAIKRIEVGIYD